MAMVERMEDDTLIIRCRTTRSWEILSTNGTGYGDERRAIDEALGFLAPPGSFRYSGEIVTVWYCGGMRWRQEQLEASRGFKNFIVNELKRYLPEPTFTGTLIFRLNSGELSGKPLIVQ